MHYRTHLPVANALLTMRPEPIKLTWYEKRTGKLRCCSKRCCGTEASWHEQKSSVFKAVPVRGSPAEREPLPECMWLRPSASGVGSGTDCPRCEGWNCRFICSMCCASLSSDVLITCTRAPCERLGKLASNIGCYRRPDISSGPKQRPSIREYAGPIACALPR